MARQTFTFVAQVPVTVTIDVGDGEAPSIPPPPASPLPPAQTPEALAFEQYAAAALPIVRIAYPNQASLSPEDINSFDGFWAHSIEAGRLESASLTWAQVLEQEVIPSFRRRYAEG